MSEGSTGHTKYVENMYYKVGVIKRSVQREPCQHGFCTFYLDAWMDSADRRNSHVILDWWGVEQKSW